MDTDGFHAHISAYFMRYSSHAALSYLSHATLASKAKNSQYHRDQNASKTNTVIPWFLLS